MEERELTFGEKAVGLTFNPSNDPKVQTIKETFAKAIDLLNNERSSLDFDSSGEARILATEKARMLSVAITELQTSQMWAVKAVTWK